VGKVLSRACTKVEDFKLHVNEEGELNEAEESEDIDETLTEPKPQSPMDPKNKEVADEAIKENELSEREILDKLNKMTTEEILSDDIDVMDMFEGMNLNPVQKPAETKNEE
jgi:hypothetical protein